MKKLLILFLCISLFSCKDESKKDAAPKSDLEPIAEVNDLTSDFYTWWSYHYYDISLASDFKPLDESSEPITKDEFLKQLTSGNYIPIEMKTEGDLTYKLYEIPQKAKKEISSTIRSTSAATYKLYKMEGNKFPEFDINDLEGNSYSNKELMGKITVLKTWFIACKPCIAEMPELNEMVDTYKNNKDIQFLSLALDKKEPLKEFLSRKEFKYAVAAEQSDLIVDKLNLQTYPLHIIVDEEGKIEKVLETATDLIAYLEKERSFNNKNTEDNRLPPPPPPPAPVDETKNAEA